MKRVLLPVIVTILLWGMSGSICKPIVGEIGSLAITAWCSLYSFLFLVFTSLIRGKSAVYASYRPKDVLIVFATGFLGHFIYRLFQSTGLRLLPAQMASVINYLWPSLTVLLGALLLKEKLSPAKVAAIFISLAGVAVNTAQGDPGFLFHGNLLGILCCVGSAVSYALYSIVSKRLHYDKESSVALSFGFASFCAFLVMAATHHFVLPTPLQMLRLVYIGAICYGLPCLTWNIALTRGNTALVSNLSYLTPVVSLFFTHYLLGERITIWSILGLTIIGLGIALQLRANQSTTA